MKLKILFTGILFLLCSCALVAHNDPAREALYTAKVTWLTGREAAITVCARKILSDGDCQKYRATDAAYTKKHNDAVDLYLQAKPLAEQTLKDLQKLADESKGLAAQINGGAK